MLSERTIINALVMIGGMILGPYLIILTFEYNQVAMLAFVAIVFVFGIFFVIKDNIVTGAFIASFFGGSLNFIPFGLTPLEVFSLMTVFYYFINYIALKRRPIDGGPRYLLIPMLIIGAIVIYHDHKLSLHALGSSEQGSRPGVLILLAIVTYLCAINIPTPSAGFLRHLPWICLVVTTVGATPQVLTTYFPSLAPYVYFISGNINLLAYLESVNGVEATDVRNGSLLGIAGTLQGVMLAYFPISTWWRPGRWILAVISLLCLAATLIGGYRNALLSFLILTLLGAICYSRLRILVVLPVMALAPLAVVFMQNSHIGGVNLPFTVQRSMSFIPGGDWDPEVKRSAETSNSFRDDIKNVYINEYLSKSPLLGNGFAFDPGEAAGYDTMVRTTNASDKGYLTTKSFIISKNFHVGWISVYDAVGIIGSIAFVALNIIETWLAGYFVFKRGADMSSALFPLKVWIFCNLFTGLVGYFTTFGSFNATFVSLCTTAVILVCIARLDYRDTSQVVSPSPAISPGITKRGGLLAPSHLS